MDLTEHIASKSDQLDYQDFLGGDRIFTITEVRNGPSAEQPVEVVLAEAERPWRPAKSMRRVLVAAWGAESAQYIGRRLELFGDSTVKWAGAAVGGIRIKALSDLDEPKTVHLTTTRGKRAPFTVQPLPDALNWSQLAADTQTLDGLRAIYKDAQQVGATNDQLAEIIGHKARLEGAIEWRTKRIPQKNS